MLVIGSAQIVNIFLSILRMKVLAVLLGPSGVGLLSIYNSLQGMVSNAAGLGMKSSGVRQLANAKGEEQSLSRVRRILLAAHLVQGVLAMLSVWLLREKISVWLLGDPTYALEVALLGIAILLSLLMNAQTALLQGLRRIEDLGRVTVLGAMGGTAVGILAIWIYGQAGLVWFVLAQPLTGLAAALYFTRRLQKPNTSHPSITETWEIWKPMARLGASFMFGGLAVTGTLLIVRGLITQELNLNAAGQFAAAWGISMTYVGLLMGAMGADYYPRLTEVIHDREAANRLMNDQLQLCLAIGGPVLLLLIGLAPILIILLYSDQFTQAVTLLQWQSVGNVFQLATWPLAFGFAALAKPKTYLLTQVAFSVIFLLIVWVGLPVIGLKITGIAFLVSYFLYFILIKQLAKRLLAFRPQVVSSKLLYLHVTLTLAMLSLVLIEPVIGGLIAIILGVVTGIIGGHVVLKKIGSMGRTAPIARIYAACGWPIK